MESCCLTKLLGTREREVVHLPDHSDEHLPDGKPNRDRVLTLLHQETQAGQVCQPWFGELRPAGMVDSMQGSADRALPIGRGCGREEP